MKGLRDSLVRFEREKIAPGTALRNSIGVAIPLLVGFATHWVPSGLLVCTGALNVSFTDGRDPYMQRLTRMFAASACCGVAVMVGGVSGWDELAAIPIVLVCAFLAGLLVAIDQPTADIGTISLVTLIVFAGHPITPSEALYSGLLAFGGGLLQTGLSVALWPLRRFEPERRALGSLFRELAAYARSPRQLTAGPPATGQFTEAQKTLSAISSTRNLQAVRLLVLLSQAERLRLSLMFLGRLSCRLEEEGSGEGTAILDEYFERATNVLEEIASSLFSGTLTADGERLLLRLTELSSSLRTHRPGGSPAQAALTADILHEMDALSGQLRSAYHLSADATPAGREDFERREANRPLRYRLLGAFPILRANLTLESAACRHAIRLAVSVTLAETIAFGAGWERSYWLPMTAAIVLRPDFTTTFTRGLLRLSGTLVGLVLATALFHVLPVSFVTEFSMIVVFTFLLRSFGPAHYGVFSVAVSALVVALLAMGGISPNASITARGINTLIGGTLALGAYAVWPTWEKTQLAEMMARLLDAYREYFHAVRESYLRQTPETLQAIDGIRRGGRMARSNMEASIERFAAEPLASEELRSAWNLTMATSHRLIHAMMALEAGLARSSPVAPRPGFRPFANDVEITLHSLSAALRGSALHKDDLPDLREDHRRLVESGNSLVERYALVNVEADRITNSLNTLRVQILALVSRQPLAIPEAEDARV